MSYDPRSLLEAVRYIMETQVDAPVDLQAFRRIDRDAVEIVMFASPDEARFRRAEQATDEAWERNR